MKIKKLIYKRSTPVEILAIKFYIKNIELLYKLCFVRKLTLNAIYRKFLFELEFVEQTKAWIAERRNDSLCVPTKNMLASKINGPDKENFCVTCPLSLSVADILVCDSFVGEW